MKKLLVILSIIFLSVSAQASPSFEIIEDATFSISKYKFGYSIYSVDRFSTGKLFYTTFHFGPYSETFQKKLYVKTILFTLICSIICIVKIWKVNQNKQKLIEFLNLKK